MYSIDEPSIKWMFASISPGMTNLPAAPIRLAPGGTAILSAGPTATMRPLSATMVAFRSGGPPFPSMSVAPTTASVSAPAGEIDAQETSRAAMANLLMSERLRLQYRGAPHRVGDAGPWLRDRRCSPQ